MVRWETGWRYVRPDPFRAGSHRTAAALLAADEKAANFVAISNGCCGRLQLGGDAMHLMPQNFRRSHQCLERQPIVAARVVGSDASLVNPEQMYSIPRKICRGHSVE